MTFTKQKKYRIYKYENVNGLGIMSDISIDGTLLFDTYEEANKKKEELQNSGKLTKDNSILKIMTWKLELITLVIMSIKGLLLQVDGLAIL